jgi:hypothetical protein
VERADRRSRQRRHSRRRSRATWLYGTEKNVSFSVGFGLDRAWYDGESVPNIRLFNVGIAF